MAQAGTGNGKPVDVAIVGGGLSGSLIAWRLAAERPELEIRLLEAGETLGGNHTWSFHGTDLPPATYRWIEPLIAHRWESQEVRFPSHERMLETAYCSVTSERLHEHLAPLLGRSLRCEAPVRAVDRNGVDLGDGTRLEASAVIDARGQRGFEHLMLGYQKFVGAVFRFDRPHGLTAPIIMDATVPQLDGYRFVYVLPFTEDTALVEDTYYADGSDIEPQDVISRLHRYCEHRNWRIEETLRTEKGVLPVAVGGDIERHLAQGEQGVAQVGLRAGLFHPLTGYSLPDAARLAENIAAMEDLSGPSLAAYTHRHAADTWADRGFYRMLSRFLFDAAKPEERYLVMQRFYKLNRGLIERFYAAHSLTQDKLRVLAGKPPVNFFKALACVSEKQWTERQRAAA
ncbi:MAG: lycopene beta-cyclase CrtY [Parvularcula sp.]|nr:lycopene beta-cyclase CrtY [Parvularcula sp.]